MVVMVAVGSWSLRHISTVGIVYVFYGINLFFGINIYASLKSIHPVRPWPINCILFSIRKYHIFYSRFIPA